MKKTLIFIILAEFITSGCKKVIKSDKSTHFNHIWSGGYTAGYFSYIRCEILDANALLVNRGLK